MIFEVADVRVRAGRAAEFEEAFAVYAPSLSRFPHFLSHELMRKLGTDDFRLFLVFGNERDASVVLEVKADFERVFTGFLDQPLAFDAFKRVQLGEPQRAVLEVAMLNVIGGREAEFEAAFRTASKIISSMKGYIHHELQRCLERPNGYVLLVHWETLEDHTVGFRTSPEYQQWRALLHHFYDPFPTVEHFTRVDLG